MRTNEVTSIGVTDTEILIEHIRNLYSQSLNFYFKLFEQYARVKKSSNDNIRPILFRLTDRFFYDAEEKINWDNVRQLLPPNMEPYLRGKYRMLNDNEIRLCCLFAFGISPKTIALIMLYNEASIPSFKHLIKRKSGIQGFADLFRDMTLIYIQNANQ